MKEDTRRAVRAFSVAPILPPFLWWLSHADWCGSPSSDFLPIVLYGAMWAYPPALLVGGPAYWLIAEHSKLRFVHVFVISGSVGAATLSLMGGTGNAETLLSGAALGVSAGVAFWLVWRQPASQPTVAGDGASPRR